MPKSRLACVSPCSHLKKHYKLEQHLHPICAQGNLSLEHMVISDNQLQRTTVVILAQKYSHGCGQAFFTIAWQLKCLPRSWKAEAGTFLLAVSLASLLWHSSVHDGTALTGKVGMTSPEIPGNTHFLDRSELRGFHPVWFQRPGSP